MLNLFLNSISSTNGVGAYVMSGDNYPRRIPRDNDAERLRTYRAAARPRMTALERHSCHT